MAARCATLDELLAVIPEFLSFGGQGNGTVTFPVGVTTGSIVTIAAKDLTGVVGARTSGSDDWSVDGDKITEAASFADAVNDPLNSFTTTATAGVLIEGTPEVLVTSVATGIAGNLPWSTSTPLTIVLDPLANLAGGETILEFFLQCACTMINIQCWGVKASNAHILLTAHLLTIAGGDEGGVASSKKIDKIQVNFSVASFDTSDAAFASTKWGRMYLALKSTVFVAPLVGTGLPRHWPFFVGSEFGLRRF